MVQRGKRSPRHVLAVIFCPFVVIALAGCSGRTEPATKVTPTSATLHAQVTWSSTSEHGVTWFEYSSNGGETWAQTPRIRWGDQGGPCKTNVPADKSGNFTQTVTGLTPGTHYVYRLAGTWCNGTKAVHFDSTGTVDGTDYSSFETPRLIARDVASDAGIARTVHTDGENCVFDYDKDGVNDLFISTHSDGPWQLFRGKGDGTFEETNVGTFPDRDRHGCATADFDGDGLADIYASIGGCEGFCRAAKELWIQRPDGTFVDRASAFGVEDPEGRGREPTSLRANDDGRPDLYAGQEVGVDFQSPNRLWINAGDGFVNPPGLPTEEIGNHCVTAGDFDRDSHDELVVCAGGTFRVYDNDAGVWSDATASVGLPTWGRKDAELVDVDGDERLDLVTATAAMLEVRLNASGRFPTRSYTRSLADGRDLALGDADGDGDKDIYVLQGTNATVPDLLLLNSGSGTSYEPLSGLPQASEGEGDRVQTIPRWKGSSRAAFLVNNGFGQSAGPRQLIELVGG